jgi:hypothetical protein
VILIILNHQTIVSSSINIKGMNYLSFSNPKAKLWLKQLGAKEFLVQEPN